MYVNSHIKVGVSEDNIIGLNHDVIFTVSYIFNTKFTPQCLLSRRDNRTESDVDFVSRRDSRTDVDFVSRRDNGTDADFVW